MQNPYMTALAQGGSVANQGMAQASETGSSIANIFNSSASLAMKMNMLLEQEEARKQQELLQTSQFMHRVQQDNFMNQLRTQQLNQQQNQFDKTYQLNKEKTDAQLKLTSTKIGQIQSAQNTINELNSKGVYYGSDGYLHNKDGSIYNPTIKEQMIIGYKPPVPKQLNPSSQITALAEKWREKNNAVYDPQTQSYYNAQTGKRIQAVPPEVCKVFGGCKPSTRTNGSGSDPLKNPQIEQGVAKDVSTYLTDENPLSKNLEIIGEIAKKYNLSSPYAVLDVLKKTNEGEYENVLSVFGKAYNSFIQNNQLDKAQQLYNVINKYDPQGAKFIKQNTTQDMQYANVISTYALSGVKNNDNEIVPGGSTSITRALSYDKLQNIFRTDPKFATNVAIMNMFTDDSGRLWGYLFSNDKKDTIAWRYFNYNLGEDSLNWDNMHKDGIISDKTYQLQQKLKNLEGNVFEEKIGGGQNLQKNKLYLNTLWSLTKKYEKQGMSKQEAIKKADAQARMIYLNSTPEYMKTKQQLMNSFKKDGIIDAYNTVYNTIRKRAETLHSFQGIPMQQAIQQAQQELVQGRLGIDKNTIVKAMIYTDFKARAYQEQ